MVTVPDADSLDLGSGMTLAAWVYPTSALSGWRDVVFKSRDMYYLEASSNNGNRPGGGGTFSGPPLHAIAPLPVATWTRRACAHRSSIVSTSIVLCSSAEVYRFLPARIGDVSPRPVGARAGQR